MYATILQQPIKIPIPIKGKVIPLHAMEALGVSRDIAPAHT
jgi:hypothetical protein